MFEHAPVPEALWRQLNWLAVFKDQTEDCNAYRRSKNHDAAPAPKHVCTITRGSRTSLGQPHTNGRKEGTEGDKANKLGIGLLNYDVILRSCAHRGTNICDFRQPFEAEAFPTRKSLVEPISSSTEKVSAGVSCVNGRAGFCWVCVDSGWAAADRRAVFFGGGADSWRLTLTLTIPDSIWLERGQSNISPQSFHCHL